MVRLNLLKKYPMIVAGLALSVMSIGLVVAVALSQQPQDIRQQASTCNQAPINVQFRVNADAATPWINGSEVNARVGDLLDVNCFAQTGSALLTNGQIVGKRNGQPLSGTLPGPDGRQVRGYLITQPGTYEFTCSDGGSCSDTDSITATGTVLASPSPSPCATYAPSDLNQDCQSNAADYQLFVSDYVEEQN